MSIAKDIRREDTLRYKRHKPEETLLYQIIDKYYAQFLDYMAQQDKERPKYVRSPISSKWPTLGMVSPVI